jgi:hypothetical protein
MVRQQQPYSHLQMMRNERLVVRRHNQEMPYRVHLVLARVALQLFVLPTSLLLLMVHYSPVVEHLWHSTIAKYAY